MTKNIEELEAKFNSKLPTVEQAELGSVKRRSFNAQKLIKAAEELKKIVEAHDLTEAHKH